MLASACPNGKLQEWLSLHPGEFKWNGSSQWKFSGKEVIPFKVLPFLHIYRNDWNFLHHLSALTICMENLVIPARIKMEWFIPVEIFWKRINTFRGLPFSRFHRNDQNFLYHLSGKPVSGFLLRRMVICFHPGPLVIWCFANGTTLTHSSLRKHFQVQYHLSEIFYQNFITNGKHSIFLTFHSKWEKTGTFYWQKHPNAQGNISSHTMFTYLKNALKQCYLIVFRCVNNKVLFITHQRLETRSIGYHLFFITTKLCTSICMRHLLAGTACDRE